MASEDSSQLPRWALIENAVAAIQRALALAGEWTVTQNAMVLERVSSRRRQVDVFLECPSGATVFRVGIDVKDESAPLDIETVEQLCAKGKKLAIDRYVIVSTSGFTAPARVEAQRQGVETAAIMRASDTPFFGQTRVSAPIVTIVKLDLAFDDGIKHPPMDVLDRAWIEDDTTCTRVHHMAFLQACRCTPSISEGDETEGKTQFLNAVDSASHFSAMYVDGVAWSPPRELHIWFMVRHEDVPSLLLRMEDGREVLATIALIDGDYRQLTVIRNATPEATAAEGSTVAISPGVLRPPRQNV